MEQGYRIDLTGQRFGRLVVLRYFEKANDGHSSWECQCDCGNKHVAISNNLRRGGVKSCGCYHRERMRENKLPDGEASFNTLFAAYKKSAKNRGYIFKLSKEQFRILTKQDCYYCEQPATNEYSGRSGDGFRTSPYLYNGIDRKNNSKGYLIENCVPCCKICNRMKHVLDYEDFIAQIRRILKTRGNY